MTHSDSIVAEGFEPDFFKKQIDNLIENDRQLMEVLSQNDHAESWEPDYTKLHYCHDFDGHYECFELHNGTLVLCYGKDKRAMNVRYCPWCGYKAKV